MDRTARLAYWIAVTLAMALLATGLPRTSLSLGVEVALLTFFLGPIYQFRKVGFVVLGFGFIAGLGHYVWLRLISPMGVDGTISWIAFYVVGIATNIGWLVAWLRRRRTAHQ
jgi:hypothetical protein